MDRMTGVNDKRVNRMISTGRKNRYSRHDLPDRDMRKRCRRIRGFRAGIRFQHQPLRHGHARLPDRPPRGIRTGYSLPRSRYGHQLPVRVIALTSEHDHAVTERKLGMQDFVACLLVRPGASKNRARGLASQWRREHFDNALKE